MICAIGLLHMRGNVSLGLVSVQVNGCYICRERAGLCRARQALGPCWNCPSKFPPFSGVLSLLRSLRLKDGGISTQHQGVPQTLPALSLCHPHCREKKNEAFLSHKNHSNYYLHGRLNSVRCRVNTGAGEVLFLHQRAQSLHR